MRAYASAYKMCVATLPKPSQPDGSIAPCRPTRSPATGSVGMADVIASAREGGEQLRFGAIIISNADERVIESRVAVQRPEYIRLGLTDAVLLELARCCGATLLTIDLNLYLAA